MKKILVFGTFDGLHEGHRAMLREAKELGSYLVVAVAPDTTASELKGTTPSHSAAERIAALKAERIADEVVLGDSELESWSIIKRVKPLVIGVGYDQHDLKSSLETFIEATYGDIETEESWQTNPKKPTIVVLQAHHPERYKSSILKR